MIDYPLPLIGFSAYSGTGKTTLLKQLLPRLDARGLRVGMVKHAHHQFDIDRHGKDSYELREAGARQMLVASRRRAAWVCEFDEDRDEPTLEQVLGMLDPNSLDLVLVEGFKRDAFAKIELHRACLGHPLLFPHDENIIAIATDSPLPMHPPRLPVLDLNRVDEIAQFILTRLPPKPDTATHDKSHPTQPVQLR